MSKVLALEYLNLHREHCITTVQGGENNDKVALKELTKAIEWVEKQGQSLPIDNVVGRSEQLKAFNEVFQLAWELVRDDSDYARLLKIKESL